MFTFLISYLVSFVDIYRKTTCLTSKSKVNWYSETRIFLFSNKTDPSPIGAGMPKILRFKTAPSKPSFSSNFDLNCVKCSF